MPRCTRRDSLAPHVLLPATSGERALHLSTSFVPKIFGGLRGWPSSAGRRPQCRSAADAAGSRECCAGGRGGRGSPPGSSAGQLDDAPVPEALQCRLRHVFRASRRQIGHHNAVFDEVAKKQESTRPKHAIAGKDRRDSPFQSAVSVRSFIPSARPQFSIWATSKTSPCSAGGLPPA